MKKTLGGDRLGSGNNMEVDLHGYERSTHDIGYLWRSTMSAGTLVPFMTELALPGTTFDINLHCDVKTHPTIGPLFGSYKVQLDTFQCPIRLYQGQLHNNRLGIGLNMASIKLPQIDVPVPSTQDPEDLEDLDNSQVNPSCLLSYLGIRGFGLNQSVDVHNRQFNALPLLMYWDIYKNYYANKQEEIGAVIHTPQPALTDWVDPALGIKVGGLTIPQAPTLTTPIKLTAASANIIAAYQSTPNPDQVIFNTTKGLITLTELTTSLTDDGATLQGSYNAVKWGITTVFNWRYITPQETKVVVPVVATFPLENLDNMRNAILAEVNTPTPFYLNDATPQPYGWLLATSNTFPNCLNSQEGLAIKTYNSDLFNNWLNTESIDGPGGITEVTAIDTSGGSFTIDTLNLSRKVYDMLNRIAVSGGSYDDWMDAVWAHDRYLRCETPMYMGGLIRELVFQEVVSNAETGGGENPTQPLGTLAGKGIMAEHRKGGQVRISVDEPSYIMGIISLTPRIDYSQGNKWDVHLQTMDDFHKPQLDEIGFQELITEQMAWWSTAWNGTTWETKSAGKQPAWINYMTNVNQTRGNFAIAGNEMFMTLNRKYEMDYATAEMKDLTTYIDPVKGNQIFAQTSLDAQNFWVQIAVDITARRKMSGKIMPNL